jgi:hypothetical protein
VLAGRDDACLTTDHGPTSRSVAAREGMFIAEGIQVGVAPDMGACALPGGKAVEAPVEGTWKVIVASTPTRCGRPTEPADVGAGGKLTPLRRLRIDPLWMVVEASGVVLSLVRLLSPRPGEGLCWTWSGGLSCAGSTSFAGSRSRS